MDRVHDLSALRTQIISNVAVTLRLKRHEIPRDDLHIITLPENFHDSMLISTKSTQVVLVSFVALHYKNGDHLKVIQGAPARSLADSLDALFMASMEFFCGESRMQNTANVGFCWPGALQMTHGWYGQLPIDMGRTAAQVEACKPDMIQIPSDISPEEWVMIQHGVPIRQGQAPVQQNPVARYEDAAVHFGIQTGQGKKPVRSGTWARPGEIRERQGIPEDPRQATEQLRRLIKQGNSSSQRSIPMNNGEAYVQAGPSMRQGESPTRPELRNRQRGTPVQLRPLFRQTGHPIQRDVPAGLPEASSPWTIPSEQGGNLLQQGASTDPAEFPGPWDTTNWQPIQPAVQHVASSPAQPTPLSIMEHTEIWGLISQASENLEPAVKLETKESSSPGIKRSRTLSPVSASSDETWAPKKTNTRTRKPIRKRRR